MSKVYGFCNAGCKWPVIAEKDMQRNFSWTEVEPNEDGTFTLNMGKKYRFFFEDFENIEVMGTYLLGNEAKEVKINYPESWAEDDNWQPYTWRHKTKTYFDFEWIETDVYKSSSVNGVGAVFRVYWFCDRNAYVDGYAFGSVSYGAGAQVDEIDSESLSAYVRGVTRVYEYNSLGNEFVFESKCNCVWNLDDEGLTFDELATSEHWEKLNECRQLILNGQCLNKDSFTDDEIVFKRLDFNGTSLSVVVMTFSYYNGTVTPDVEEQTYNFAS